MCDIKPELIEKLTEALRGVRMGDCLPEPLTPTSDEALDLAHAALEAVADDLRAEGAAQALREAADDIERRINEPDLILMADKYGGFHAGERHRAQREVDILRARAERNEAR